jgi:hypothetical protein
MNYTHSLPPQEGAASYMKLSHELIQRLNKAGFNWSLQEYSTNACFEERFNDLMAFKVIHGGHCDVSRTVHEYASLGRCWCWL